jgi:hypothetical protein
VKYQKMCSCLYHHRNRDALEAGENPKRTAEFSKMISTEQKNETVSRPQRYLFLS